MSPKMTSPTIMRDVSGLPERSRNASTAPARFCIDLGIHFDVCSCHLMPFSVPVSLIWSWPRLQTTEAVRRLRSASTMTSEVPLRPDFQFFKNLQKHGFFVKPMIFACFSFLKPFIFQSKFNCLFFLKSPLGIVFRRSWCRSCLLWPILLPFYKIYTIYKIYKIYKI